MALPCPSLSVVGGRVGQDVMRVGDLSLLSASYNTHESVPCASLEQHSRVGPGGIGIGEPALRQ